MKIIATTRRYCGKFFACCQWMHDGTKSIQMLSLNGTTKRKAKRIATAKVNQLKLYAND